MSFNSWYSKSIKEAQVRNEKEARDEIAAKQARDDMDRWAKETKIREEKERLAREYNESTDLWGI